MKAPYTPYEDGGIAGPNYKQALLQGLPGGTAGVQAPPLTVDDPAAPVAPAAPKKTYALEGFDAGKLASDHASPKYQIGRVLQNFDPRQGLTPDVLAELNKLNLGTFSGQGDKLTVGGQVDPRFEGFTNIDVVRGFHDPNGTGGWQYGAENPNAPRGGGPAAGGPRPGGLPSFGGSTISPMLQGDAQSHIQQALSGLQNPDRLQALIAALGGQ